ncbi:MAG: zinc-finger domain-containing protein [Candidatus Levyibacteriota bacterium]
MAETREMPVVVVQAKDLPVYCPNPSMPLWSSHPRVYLDVADEGEVLCPYCGTRYRLEGGAGSGGH